MKTFNLTLKDSSTLRCTENGGVLPAAILNHRGPITIKVGDREVTVTVTGGDSYAVWCKGQVPMLYKVLGSASKANPVQATITIPE